MLRNLFLKSKIFFLLFSGAPGNILVLGPVRNFTYIDSYVGEPTLYLSGVTENTSLQELILSYEKYTKIKVSNFKIKFF